MNNKQALAAIAALALVLPACKKDKDEDPEHEHHHATINMAFTFQVNGEEWTVDSLLSDSLGHALKVNSARFFVSGIHAENDEDVLVGEWPESYLLVDAAGSGNTITLGEMEVGHIHQFHFDLGLDSTANHADPTLASAPLNDATMHWNWDPAAGYKFLVLEGRYDDDGDGIVQADDPEFIFHCATDDLLTEAHAHVHHTVVEGETFTAQVLVDMARLFDGIDVLATPSAMGGGPVNARLMTNLSGAIDGVE